jgi:hypothetical protein
MAAGEAVAAVAGAVEVAGVNVFPGSLFAYP